MAAKLGKGLDIGTVNLVSAVQDDEGKVVLRKMRNAFIDIPMDNFSKNMLSRLKVPYVVHGKKMYVLGDSAFELANVLNRNTRRPMADGLISPKEQDALPIMRLLIDSILDKPRVANELVYYCVPAEPIDSTSSVMYHRDVFDGALKSLGYSSKYIIEGHAIVFSELANEDFTGIGISCGGGMFNICVCYKSMPCLSFSICRGGDWIDNNVAHVLAIKPAKASMLKEKGKETGMDISKPRNREEEAIGIFYRNLMNYTLSNIKSRFESAENMPSFPEPIEIVLGGGTSMIGGFIPVVEEELKKLEGFPIPYKKVRLASDPFNAVAKGTLMAALSETA
jgi:actin-like ATPase involved in cell morphogenesis